MRDDAIKMIESFSESIDELWATVLKEEDESEEESSGFLQRKRKEAPTSELDLQIEKALSHVDNENGLGCIFDGFLFPSPSYEADEDTIIESTQLSQVKGGDIGLPPRPGRAKTASKSPQESRESTSTRMMSFLFPATTGTEKEQREESCSNWSEGDDDAEDMAQEDEEVDDASVKSVGSASVRTVGSAISLVRRISFKRVGSSMRRSEKPTPQGEEDDNSMDDLFQYSRSSSDSDDAAETPPQVETQSEGTNETGFFSFLLPSQEETREGIEQIPGSPSMLETTLGDDQFWFLTDWFVTEEMSSTPTSSSNEKLSNSKKSNLLSSARSLNGPGERSRSHVGLVRRRSNRRDRRRWRSTERF